MGGTSANLCSYGPTMHLLLILGTLASVCVVVTALFATWRSSRCARLTDMSVSCLNRPCDDTILLAGKADHYGGFIIDSDALPSDASTFHRSLCHSLAHWKSEGRKGIWLKVMIDNVDLVPLAVKEGFKYHHAEKDFVMLTKWIAEDIESTIPANASHQVGIGAIVVNDQNEILVVQEKTGPTQGSGVWKMPTGVVNQGEDIKDAAVREVKEETSVVAEFVEILGIRQAHNVAFGKSDMFCLCLLRPSSSEIVIQENEIAAAQWMPLEKFKAQEFNSESDFLMRIEVIVDASMANHYRGFVPELLSFGFRKKGSLFYHNIKDIHSYLEQKTSKL